MSVTSVHRNPEALAMSITATFDAPVEEVWGVWADPRKLECWWGPPTYPATVVDHELWPGGRVSYFMTSPAGERHRGWWRVLTVESPHRLEFEGGLADSEGEPDPEMPTMTTRVSLTRRVDGGTTMVVETTFPTLEAISDRRLARLRGQRAPQQARRRPSLESGSDPGATTLARCRSRSRVSRRHRRASRRAPAPAARPTLG